VAGSINGIPFFAQSHLDGVPLSRRIRNSNRAVFLHEVNGFLRALNSELPDRAARGVSDIRGPEVGEPMVGFVLRHVEDSALRAKARAMIEDSLRGAVSRRGIVHGDFGASNILVSGARITGVIDWEAARGNAPPVLDAFNYLDSAHRSCSKGLSIVDTLPLLADGDWPVSGELDFLREYFQYCGVDFRYRKGFALLYMLFHIGPQLRFVGSEEGPKRRLEQVLRRM
jgi:aminoglycoside phosphotransferase (APT) family kinase protein